MNMHKNNLTEKEMKAFEPTEKIGIIATRNNEGLPHVTLLTTMAALSENKLALGQFSHGLSKLFMQKNREVGFLVLTLNKEFIRGTATWTHKAQEGPEYELFNNMPMFRYNTYFGINTVHYLDLMKTSDLKPLPMSKIIAGALISKFIKGSYKNNSKEDILNPFSQSLFNELASLCFLSYINNKGVPQIIPLIQCQAADSRTLAFSAVPFGRELSEIPQGTDVAVLGMTMKMVNVLVRGKFTGVQRKRGMKSGAVTIQWVYNSLPPAHGQIYPEKKLEPVITF